MTKMGINIPIGRKIDQIIPTSFIAIPSKIDPKWDFWFENMEPRLFP
jgi:hypothetical protein